MGSFQLTNKVKATVLAAVITFLVTWLGLDLDKQTETLINALVPVIVGYLWVEDWDTFRPNRKILLAGITAIVVYAAFRLGINVNKTVENFINALLPVVVAYLVPEPQGTGRSSQTRSRTR